MTEKKPARKRQPKFVVWSEARYVRRQPEIVSAANPESAARKFHLLHHAPSTATVTVAPLNEIQKFKFENVLKVTEKKVNDA